MQIIQYLFNTIQDLTNIISKKDKQIAYLKKKNKRLESEIKNLKNIHKEPLKDDSISPYYNPTEIVDPPLLVKKVIEPIINYKELLKIKKIKPSSDKAISKLINKEQLCLNCGSNFNYHYMNSPTQKICKCCKKTVSNKTCNNLQENRFICPHCNHTLQKRISRDSFDVFACKNKKCSYRLNCLKNNPNPHKRDKISYIFRKCNINFNSILEHISNNVKTSISFNFRKFNFNTLSLALYFKVNLRLSNRDTAIALKELFNISISHTTISNYCSDASKLISVFNSNFKYIPSNELVADETYIKVKGIKHYVWIVYDLKSKTIISYNISKKRDIKACLIALTKAFQAYGNDIPSNITFYSDMYTAYPRALQTIQSHFNTKIKHLTVKGLQVIEGESREARIAKQKIERLNRIFKQSYRVTTGFATLEGAINSFELWMFYFNFLRVDYDTFKPKKSLNFISKYIDKDFFVPNKWLYTLNYIKDNFVQLE